MCNSHIEKNISLLQGTLKAVQGWISVDSKDAVRLATSTAPKELAFFHNLQTVML